MSFAAYGVERNLLEIRSNANHIHIEFNCLRKTEEILKISITVPIKSFLDKTTLKDKDW